MGTSFASVPTRRTTREVRAEADFVMALFDVQARKIIESTVVFHGYVYRHAPVAVETVRLDRSGLLLCFAMPAWTAETADWYAENYGEYPTNRLGIDAFDFRNVSTVVDVGCGTGAALRHLAKNHPHLQLIGVDPVPRMIDIARERLSQLADPPRIEFRIGPAESIPVDDSIADVVLAFDSFDHWREPRLALSEIRRILRPGGRFVVLKDGGAPGPAGSKALRQQTIAQAAFTLLSDADLAEGDVSCAMSIYRCDPHSGPDTAPGSI
jgi:SAM-dependent methyltransferase